MNYVSFETAKKLKENGFKQPNPTFGQVWYDLDGQAILVSKIVTYDKGYTGFKKVICQSAEASHLQYDLGLFDCGEVIYAPTTSEIILPQCVICQNDTSTRIFRDWREFEDGRCFVENSSDAEAKAEAFLCLYSS